MAADYGLFQACGIEIEYMLVDSESLSIRPAADRALEILAGEPSQEVLRGEFCWSNELALHVIEIKTAEPARSLTGLGLRLAEEIHLVDRMLQDSLGLRLMPTGMHPWMDPRKESALWPHENNEIYEAYNRIFGCQGHGWTNLQSVHLNLPFSNDEEFGRLHAAIRLVLPILPALAASSPLIEGEHRGFLDQRLEVYRHNQDRVPLITGRVIPDSVDSPLDYQSSILQPMYAQIAPLDPEGILQEEWLNSQGAIARFERNTIEIRLLDAQESPVMDLAIAELAIAAIRGLVEEKDLSWEFQTLWPTETLAGLLEDCLRLADQTPVNQSAYLNCFGISSNQPINALEVWRQLAWKLSNQGLLSTEAMEALGLIFHEGCLARRILNALQGDFSHSRIMAVYQQLCECLENRQPFCLR